MKFVSLLIIALLLIPFAYAKDYSSMNEIEVEKAAYVGLYSTIEQMTGDIDKLDPMGEGEDFQAVLDQKISLVTLAINGLEPLTAEPYHTNKGEPFTDTYNKAVTAKAHLESKLVDLNEFKNKKVNKDGEIEDSGFLGILKKKYDNNDMKTKLKEAETKKDEPDDDTGFFSYFNWSGNSKYLWILIIIGIVFWNRSRIEGAMGRFEHRMNIYKLENNILKETNDKLLKHLKDMLDHIEKVLGNPVSSNDETMKKLLKLIPDWSRNRQLDKLKDFKKSLENNEKKEEYVKIAKDFDKLIELLVKRRQTIERIRDRLGLSHKPDMSSNKTQTQNSLSTNENDNHGNNQENSANQSNNDGSKNNDEEQSDTTKTVENE